MTLLDFAVVQHLAEELLPQLIDFSCVSQFTRRA
jgi:hypothetical protein